MVIELKFQKLSRHYLIPQFYLVLLFPRPNLDILICQILIQLLLLISPYFLHRFDLVLSHQLKLQLNQVPYYIWFFKLETSFLSSPLNSAAIFFPSIKIIYMLEY